LSHKPSLNANNGTGTALLFFRHVEPAWKEAATAPVYEATLWFTALYLPLIPLSTWVVRPIGIRRIQTGLNKFLTTYEVDFMERLPAKPLAVTWMYMKIVFHLAVMIAPAAFSILAGVFDASPGIHWPDVDEDLSTEGLLRGAPAASTATKCEPRAIFGLIDYIHGHPERCKLVARPEDWRWSIASWCEGKNPLAHGGQE
jgi:hypothetical protein